MCVVEPLFQPFAIDVLRVGIQPEVVTVDEELHMGAAGDGNPSVTQAFPSQPSAHGAWVVVLPVEVHLFQSFPCLIGVEGVEGDFVRLFGGGARSISTQAKTNVFNGICPEGADVHKHCGVLDVGVPVFLLEHPIQLVTRHVNLRQGFALVGCAVQWMPVDSNVLSRRSNSAIQAKQHPKPLLFALMHFQSDRD